MKNMIVMILETSWKKFYRKVTNAWNGKLLVAALLRGFRSCYALNYFRYNTLPTGIDKLSGTVYLLGKNTHGMNLTLGSSVQLLAGKI